ncbi:MAG: type I methionyl aminopeptidase [Coprothermobacter proteolyticus]|nr:type I methionyl aminopeptidase [Coprothermobacter sp.]
MVYDKSALKHMREAGLRLTEVIYKLREEVVAGITGEELDAIAEKLILSLNSIPSFKGYGGFPASVCISVDDVVIHGIPSKRPLLPGQLVSIDLGLIYDGWNSDAAFTVILPPVQEGKKKLSDVTLKALRNGVSKIKPGIHLGDISAQIQKVAQEAGVGIVRDFTGHGIGRHLHEDPPIPNFGRPHTGPVLKPYMFLAVEPMFTEGSGCVVIESDGWTVRTCDHTNAAHFEFTVAVTDDGAEVLTPHV